MVKRMMVQSLAVVGFLLSVMGGLTGCPQYENTALITVSYSNQPMAIGWSEQFQATSTIPGDTNFIWTSDDETVATVSSNGAVLAQNVGSTTIRATSASNGASGYVMVTVINAEANKMLWDGESGWTGGYGALNTEKAFRGNGCLEGLPDPWHSPSINLDGYPGYREDISGFDEVWFFSAVSELGKSMAFKAYGWPYSSNEVLVDQYVEDGVMDSEWKLVRIPIADLATADYALDKVEIFFFGVAIPTQGHSIFVDEIWAVNMKAFDGDSFPLMGPLSSVDYGETAVHGVNNQVINLTNAGTAEMTVTTVALEGPHSDEFIVSTLPFTIAPGATYALNVSFSPFSVGDKSTNLILAHDMTPMGSTTTVPLSGCAMAPAIALSCKDLDFGSVAVGQSSTKYMTVTNPGNMALQVSSITATAPSFQSTPSTFTLDAGGEQQVQISFVPTVTETISDTLRIQSNATDDETKTVGLAAAAVPADATGSLSVEVEATSSATVDLSWPQLSNAASIKIYLGPEPAATANAPLPMQLLLATVAGDASGYTAVNLAPAADMFFHVEVLDAGGAIIAQGNTHARTVGGPKAELDTTLREIHLVSPNILQVVVAIDAVHSYTIAGGDVDDGGINRVVGDVGTLLQQGTWSVTRETTGAPINVAAIYRQSIPVGSPYHGIGMESSGSHINLLDHDHVLYLVLDEAVGNRDMLKILGPMVTRETMSLTHDIGQFTFQPECLLPFSDLYLETSVIQVNQMGYSPRATERYAYVSGYMGDGGPLALDAFPAQAKVLLDPENPLDPRSDVVTGLPISLRSVFDVDAGTEVCEIDLKDMPAAEGTVYRVHIPGVGVSWPTQVSETAVYRTFYQVSRALTHNRWGRELNFDWTEWGERPADHLTVFTGERSFEQYFFPEDTPQVGQRTLAGGHHDAADFDIGPSHYLVGLFLLRLFENQPGVFTDGQLTIPESGNGIPDILDEALYSLAAWEQLQEADGGVRSGVESYSHPRHIDFADNDPLPYWTYGRDAIHTVRVAGLFAQASRLLRPYNEAKADELASRAIAAFDYAMANGVTADVKGPPTYAASELYALTGEQRYRDLFEGIWEANDPWGNGMEVYYFHPWASTYFEPIQVTLADYVFGYLRTPGSNPTYMEKSKVAMTAAAEEAIQRIDTLHAHRNGRPTEWNIGWGRGVTVGEYVISINSRLQLGGVSAEDKQRYINAISLSADYVLGCNPMGKVWLTGMGSREVTEIMHADSQVFRKLGMGNIPGMGVYGPVTDLPNVWNYDYALELFYPGFNDLPPQRRYADLCSWVNTNEFTVKETNAPHILLFGMLMSPGMTPPDSWLPFGENHQNKLAPRESVVAGS